MLKIFPQRLFMALLGLTLTACVATDTRPSKEEITSSPIKTISAIQQHNIDGGKLTLEKIMSDPDWLGRQPESPFWSDDSQAVLYSRKRHGQALTDLWYKPLSVADNGSQVGLAQLHQHDYSQRVLNRDRNKAAWLFSDNLFVKDLATGEVKQLSRGGYPPTNIQFLNDGRISYQIGNGVYAIDPSSGLTEQLVSWQFAEAPQALPEAKDYIAQQQHKLIETVAKQRQQRQQAFDYQQQLQQQNPTLAPAAFYFPEGLITNTASLSPNGRWLLLVVQKPAAEKQEQDIMPDYINENGRIEAQQARTMVADSEPRNQQIWLVDIQRHQQHELSYSSLPGYNEDVLAAVKQQNAELKGESYQVNRLPRAIGLLSDWYWSAGAIRWQANGNDVAIMLEAWDNKDRWLTTVDFAKKLLQTQERLHDDAWINYRFNSFGWLNKSSTLYYLSEKSGYANLYTQVPGKRAQALVSGAFEVDNISISADDKNIYYQANKTHPGIYEVYRVDVDNGQHQQLTNLGGMVEYQLSPDESKLLLTYSSLTLPPELYVQDASPQAPIQRLTHTVSDEFLSYNWSAPDIVAVPSSHGQQPIFSRVYQPQKVLEGAARRAVIFNHGAGYLQNSHLGWSTYFREFMFHSLLVEQGYVVMDMDYRASRGYGRDWRTAIYRQMGTPEIEDLVDGVDWLVENANVDRQRIGTYGGSYGGFMTFMAMFKQPELFQAGAALRPVSDWVYYNTEYTSNILNTPDVDPIAYQRSSPIYFAEGLQKPLLINAPMVDSNVFFVDVVRLVQRFIELEKQDFETAIFPVESHGFVQPSSWLNEYRKIYKLFEENL
ncbi:prolyl oligopeptidase family serine peptidase [Alteromonadaceae bacterium BrNp21-10]|nr:prolyl oligopeptidase family serine peptidase [Alteromonadaceae bacterium BrNp21-10]